MPLPPGYKLDRSTKEGKTAPKLPPGYTLDAAPVDATTAAASAPSVADSTPSPEGFLASAVAPFTGIARGLKSAVYEGPQNPTEEAVERAGRENSVLPSPLIGRAILAAKRILLDPQIEQGKQAVEEFKQAGTASPWYSFHPSPEAVSHRELALGHGLAAAVPALGPWAAQVGQKEGEQLGTGNYSGAAGTALGNSLLALAPKVIGKVWKTVPNAIRSIAGSGTRVAKDLARNAAEKNRVIDAQNAQTALERTGAENMLNLRRQHEQDYRQATAAHYAKEAAADTQAKATENVAWSAWRQKTAGKTLDGGQITGPLEKLRLDSPEVDRTLNQLEPRGDEVPQESPYAQIRARVAQEQYGNQYEALSPVKQDQVDDLLHSNGYSPEPIAFDPRAGQPISIDRVQRASSILQRYIRSGRFEGPLLGEMKQVAKVLRNAVTRASTDVGAAPELDAARTSTVTYQNAFGRERRAPATARTVREKQVNPEAYRERADEERLAKAYRYDPTLVDSYRKVKAAREALKKLPAEEQLRKSLKQPAPRVTISADDLQRANDAAVRARANGLAGHLFWWTGVWPAFRMLSELSRGAEVSLKPLALMPAAGAAGMATEELLSQPAVLNFFTRATRQQIATIPPDLRGAMPEIVSMAKARGVPVSPILAAYAATIGRNRGEQSGQPDQPTPAGASQ